MSLIAQSSTAGWTAVRTSANGPSTAISALGQGAEADAVGVHDVPGLLRFQADQPHGRRVERHRVAAGQQHVEVDRVPVDRPPALHADQTVHQRQGDRPQLVDVADQLVQVLVQEDPVIPRDAAPLVFQGSGEDGRGVRLEDRERHESVGLEPGPCHAEALEPRVGQVHHLILREVEDFQTQLGGEPVDAVVLEGRLGGVAGAVGLDDRDPRRAARAAPRRRLGGPRGRCWPCASARAARCRGSA